VVTRALAGLGVLLTFATLSSGPSLAAEPAPGFRVKLLDSAEYVDSRELVGKKVLVLRFQASYCKPCVRESGALAKVDQRYRNRDVVVLAVHVQDTAADVRKFVKSQRATYRVALDPQLTIGNRFGFKGTPYTVVIDRNGDIVSRLKGASAVTRLPRVVDGLLGSGS
jgi:peroxiredoxin